MLLAHDCRGRLRTQEIALVVNRGHEIEIGFGDFVQTTCFKNTRVGDQHVETAKGINRRLYARLNGFLRGDIDRQEDRSTSPKLFAHSVNGGLPRFGVDVSHNDVCSLSGQPFGDAFSKALSAARDDHDTTRQARGARCRGFDSVTDAVNAHRSRQSTLRVHMSGNGGDHRIRTAVRQRQITVRRRCILTRDSDIGMPRTHSHFGAHAGHTNNNSNGCRIRHGLLSCLVKRD